MNNITKIILLLISLTITGCGHKTYSGRFFIADSRSVRSDTELIQVRNKVNIAIREIATEFGFTQHEKLSWMDDDIISFGKRKKGKHDNLSGSESAILLLIESVPNVSIAIKDYRNTFETDFIIFLKAEIKKKIEENTNIKNVTFKRHWDWID